MRNKLIGKFTEINVVKEPILQPIIKLLKDTIRTFILLIIKNML